MKNKKIKLGILKEFKKMHEHYIDACEALGIDYQIIDITANDWIEQINNSNCDGYLVRPSYAKGYWKTLFDERLYFLNQVMNKKIFPSYLECFIYENKKNMAYWLESNDIQHAKTDIFYNKQKALEFLKSAKYPLLFKPNISSAGVGVKKIENFTQGKILVNKIFPKGGILGTGFIKWHKRKHHIFKKPMLDDRQYGYIMFQEFLNVKVEWRMIKIGESYFGHQKLAGKNGLHSGSLLVGWVDPPKKLLNYVKEICNKGNFESMDVDIFETVDGKYYVNELQTVFGSYNDSQMYINDKPGRYKFKNGKWVFEEGYFNKDGSYRLRVETFIKKIRE